MQIVIELLMVQNNWTILVCVLLAANSVWSFAGLRLATPGKVAGYGLNFGIGLRHEQSKPKLQA